MELATKIKAGIFKPYRKTPEWQFELPIDWSADPFKDNNWKVSLHAFYMLQPLILQYESDGDPSHLSLALRIVLDWGRFHYEENRETRFSFYDFSSGIRCTYMAWLYDALASRRDAGIASSDELVQFTRIINDHIERVLDGRIELRLTNHGLFQIHGLACLYHTLPSLTENERIKQFIRDRLPTCLNAQFDTEFIHQEHSPGYHDLATNKLSFFIDSGLYEDYPILEQIYYGAKKNIFWLTDPAGNLWAVGDSYAQKSRECGLVQHDWEISDSIRMRRFDFGYVSIKSHPETPLQSSSGLFVQGAFHSSIHKHLDDLSFELFEKGERLLIDSGAYGYQVSNERRYFQSTRAHNTVEIDGVNFSRKSEYAYGSAINVAEFRGDHFYIKASVHHKDLKAFHQRELFYQPGAWLILRDNVEREQSCSITQWFHLGASCKLVKQDGDSIEFKSSNCNIVFINTSCNSRLIRKGQHKPELQGWYSPSDRTLVENFAIGFESTKDTIETIILIDPCFQALCIACAVFTVPRVTRARHHMHIRFQVTQSTSHLVRTRGVTAGVIGQRTGGHIQQAAWQRRVSRCTRPSPDMSPQGMHCQHAVECQPWFAQRHGKVLWQPSHLFFPVGAFISARLKSTVCVVLILPRACRSRKSAVVMMS